MRIVRIEKFVTEQDDFEWLIDGLLPNVGWTLLYGERGVGKTTFAVQMATAIQGGTPFLGRQCKQRNIMYIQADSATVEWRMILKRVAPKGQGFTVVDVPHKALGNPQYIQSLSMWIDKYDPGFVVWDSLYNLSAWSINNEQALQPIFAIKGMCGVRPWMLIHHPPHGESRSAGHHSIAGNCSNEWGLLKTMLKINKGRIMGDKQVIEDKAIHLDRDTDGVWVVKGDDDMDDTGTSWADPFLNRRIR